jgi:uncharacterized protein YlxW (UPF0749 family)
MSDIKKSLMAQGMRLMADPRVMKLMQDERVMKAVMAAMAMPGKAQTFARQQAESVARAMALATQDEVKDLRRTVRKLEDEVDRLRRTREQPTAEAKAPRAKKSPSAS